MTQKHILIVWVTLKTLAQLRTLSLAENELLIVQAPRQDLENIAIRLHADPRILNVVADDEALEPFIGSYTLVGAKLFSERLIPLAYSKPASRPDLYDAYPAYCRQSEVLQSDRTIEILGPSWSMPLPPQRDIAKFREKHNGERIYVLGNGPSLADVDPSLLRSAITIGSNAVHLMFERWGFGVDYWMCEDRLQIEQELKRHRRAIGQRSIPVLPFEYAANADWPEAYYYPLSMSDGRMFPDGVSYPDFSPFGRAFRHGYTVTTSAIHLAVYLGASEIILLGVDHNYELSGERAEQWKADDASSPTHFDASYTEGRSFIRPRPLRAEQAYQAACDWCDANGVQILNASNPSALDVFDKTTL